MTYGGLGEMFKGDSADTCGGKFPFMPMGGRAEGLLCADPGARTPIGVSRNFESCLFSQKYTILVIYFGSLASNFDKIF